MKHLPMPSSTIRDTGRGDFVRLYSNTTGTAWYAIWENGLPFGHPDHKTLTCSSPSPSASLALLAHNKKTPPEAAEVARSWSAEF